MMTPKSITTITTSQNLSEGVPDSKVGNLGAYCAPPRIEKSSRLLEALLRLDEKYASAKDGNSQPEDKQNTSSAPSGTCVTDSIKSVAISQSSHARLMKSMSSAKGSAPLRVRLCGNYVLSSAAATPLTSVQALSPIGVQDFSSFAALYDLQRTVSLRVFWQVASNANINGTIPYALAFDPSNIGAYGGVPDVLTAEQHVGPGTLSGSGVNISALPTSTNSTHPGYNSWDVKIRTQKYGLRNDSTASNAVGGSYVGTSDTTSVVGWIKPYVASAGGAVTTTITLFVVYDVEFSTRT